MLVSSVLNETRSDVSIVLSFKDLLCCSAVFSTRVPGRLARGCLGTVVGCALVVVGLVVFKFGANPS